MAILKLVSVDVKTVYGYSASRSSATTLVSIRNTRVFRTALTALTEPRTLSPRITRYLSRCTRTSCMFWWHIRTIRTTHVLHSSHWLQLCWSRFFSGHRFFGNAAGAPGNHSYYLSFNNFQNLCIQFVFSSMYLCIYIATYLHTVYLDWQHAVIVLHYPCISVHLPSLINDVLRGCDWASWELHLEAEIEWPERCT